VKLGERASLLKAPLLRINYFSHVPNMGSWLFANIKARQVRAGLLIFVFERNYLMT
jgi:hypothetical protein